MSKKKKVVFGIRNSFTLILDTKAPELKMYIPTYAQYGETVEFIVEYDEKIDIYKQNAYVMFGKNRYDIVLSYDEANDRFVGLFNTAEHPAPSCVVYVELYDDVGNKGVVSSGVEIFSNKELSADYYLDTNQVFYEYNNKNITYDIDKMVVNFDVAVE